MGRAVGRDRKPVMKTWKKIVKPFGILLVSCLFIWYAQDIIRMSMFNGWEGGASSPLGTLLFLLFGGAVCFGVIRRFWRM